MGTVISFFKNNVRQYAMVLALIAIMLFFQFLTGGIMFKPMNITNLILQNAYVLILAIGMLLVIITGNIDLSVGSIVAFVGSISAIFMVDMQMDVVTSIVLCLIIGALVGAFHGYFIAFLKIPAFIVTLAGMLIFRGFTIVILQGETKAPFDKGFQSIGAGYMPGMDLKINELNIIALLLGLVFSILFIISVLKNRKNKQKYHFEVIPMWLECIRIILLVCVINFMTFVLAQYNGIPIILIVLVGLILIYSFITQRTIPGRHIYAIGGNAKAARLSGVKTTWVQFWVFVNMGLLSALTALVVTGRLNAATAKAGDGFELDAIGACFIGGASASGGVGTVVGTIVGGLVMGVLNNGMSIMGVGVDWQKVIKGFVLLGAVCFDVYTKSRSHSK